MIFGKKKVAKVIEQEEPIEEEQNSSKSEENEEDEQKADEQEKKEVKEISENKLSDDMIRFAFKEIGARLEVLEAFAFRHKNL
jgi:hypothetical protein